MLLLFWPLASLRFPKSDRPLAGQETNENPRSKNKCGAQNGKTLTDVIEDALREKLSRWKTNQKRKPVKLTTVTGRGVRGGIDLDDSAELLEIMENSSDST